MQDKERHFQICTYTNVSPAHPVLTIYSTDCNLLLIHEHIWLDQVLDVPCVAPVCSTVWAFWARWGPSGNQPTGTHGRGQVLHCCCLLAAINWSSRSAGGHRPGAPLPWMGKKTKIRVIKVRYRLFEYLLFIVYNGWFQFLRHAFPFQLQPTQDHQPPSLEVYLTKHACQNF